MRLEGRVGQPLWLALPHARPDIILLLACMQVRDHVAAEMQRAACSMQAGRQAGGQALVENNNVG